MSHDVGWSLTAGAPIYSSPPVRSDSFFCWFFCTLTTLRTFHDCTLCQRADITSWPLIQVRTLIITYFSGTTCIFWYIYINSGTPSLSCYVHVYQFSDKLYRIKNTIRVSRFSYITHYKGENNFSFLKNSPFWHYINSFTRPNRVYVRLIPNDLYFQTICTA